jgi:hypothetical protein
MKGHLVLILVCISALYAGCSSDGPTDVDDSVEEPIATATIGPSGGTLATEDFILDVPAGAFDSSEELKLYIETEPMPYSDNAVSDLFRLEGLPATSAVPLRIALRYEGTLSEESYGAIGQDLFIKSLGDTATTYVLFEAADSSGFLVFELPGQPNSQSTTALLANAVFQPPPMKAAAVTNIHHHTTPAGHFRVEAPKNKVTRSQMEDVGNQCEDAYDTYSNMGFRYNQRNPWPIKVVLMHREGSYGSYASSMQVEGFGFLTFDIDVLSEPDQLTKTVGHEFLHLVQDLYDPRPWEEKTSDYGPKYWLDEATACYCEKFFSGNPDTHVPELFTENQSTPFKGIHKQGDDAGEHGYGMSAMIKYLTGRFPSSTVVNYYTDISSEMHPVETIIARSNGTSDWLGDFFREYVQGNIYGVGPAYWKGQIRSHQVFRIATASDTVKKFDSYYEPMGARLYQVDLDYLDIPEGLDISFTLTGPYDEETEVSVLKQGGAGAMELIDHSTTGVVVENVKDLIASWHDLYALVTNRNIEPPYTDDTDIRLAVRLQGGFNPTGCAIVVRDIDANFQTVYTAGGSSQSAETHGAGFPKEQGATVEFTGTTLTQLHDHVGNDGNHYVGSMTVTFDAAFQNVATFSAVATISRGDWTTTSTLSGQNIPLETDGATKIFKVSGVTTCGKITSMTWIGQYSTYTKTLLPGWTCNDESEIEVWVFTN